MLESVVLESNEKPLFSVIWLHGLGADGHDFEPIVPELNLPDSLKIRFIFPHAPVRPITINANIPMRAWYDIYSLEEIVQEDIKGIKKSEEDVKLLIQKQIEIGIPPENILLAGFSQGGAIALYTGLRYPKKLRGILSLSAYMPLINQLQEDIHQSNQKIPIFMAHGEYDQVLPMQFGIVTRDTLEKLNYPVEWHTYPMGHEVCFEEIQDVRQWLSKLLL